MTAPDVLSGETSSQEVRPDGRALREACADGSPDIFCYGQGCGMPQAYTTAIGVDSTSAKDRQFTPPSVRSA